LLVSFQSVVVIDVRFSIVSVNVCCGAGTTTATAVLAIVVIFSHLFYGIFWVGAKIIKEAMMKKKEGQGAGSEKEKEKKRIIFCRQSPSVHSPKALALFTLLSLNIVDSEIGVVSTTPLVQLLERI
jgi:hypothetical protein